MKTSMRLSQIASAECFKKQTMLNHPNFTLILMLLFISGQLIFLLSDDSKF